MEDRKFPRRFIDTLRPGAYLRIIVEGDVGAGDEIRVIGKPLHDLTIREFFRIYYSADPDALRRLTAIPGISESWREWAESLLQKTKSGDAAAVEFRDQADDVQPQPQVLFGARVAANRDHRVEKAPSHRFGQRRTFVVDGDAHRP